MMQIGNNVILLTPYKGHRTGTLVEYNFPYWTVRLYGGLEIRLYEDELKKED